jgi:phage terminase large subunit-like protein
VPQDLKKKPPSLSKLSPEARRKIEDAALAAKAATQVRPWEKAARNKQLPPDHPRHHLPWTHPRTGAVYSCGCTGPSRDWTTWIFLAGRGTGKTKAGAEWSVQMALSEPGIYVGVCAPTYLHVRKTCFEDLQSGIIASALPGEIAEINRNNMQITMRNGSIIQGFSAENVDSVRGANLSYCWFDELAMIKFVRFFDYGLKPALRIKPRDNDPRLMITTTPSRLRLIRDLVETAQKDPRRYHITTASSTENPFFAEGALEDLRRQYRGTYLEQQELEGRLVDGSDGALFSAENFCDYRIYPDELPELRRVVVAIDPASTSSETSDETGIVVAAEGPDHHFFILDDCSLRGTPKECMQRVARAFHRWEADLVVGENTVGDYMPELLAKEDPNIPYKSVHAMKGKYIRAEPVSYLAAGGRMHFVGDNFELLEKQLCAMTPDIERSRQHDDRADAAIWALIELSRRSGSSYSEMYGFYPCTKCGNNINQMLDRECRTCGEPVTAKEKEKVRDRASRWHSAYTRTCKDGHERPLNLADCPQCGTSATFYLQKLAEYTQNPGGMAVYTGKDWLAAR